MSIETWKPIAGHPHYEVSSFGRVRSLNRASYNAGIRRTCNLKGVILRDRSDKDGYRLVTFSQDGAYSHHKVHALVAKAFIPTTQPAVEVNHKDRNRANNHANNLEWLTHAENVAHACEGNTRRNTCGRQVVAIAEDGASTVFASIKEAERNGFSRGAIHKCLAGVWSKHAGFAWRSL